MGSGLPANCGIINMGFPTPFGAVIGTKSAIEVYPMAQIILNAN